MLSKLIFGGDDNYSHPTPGYNSSDYPDCPDCGETMGYNYFKDEFKCPSCGKIMDAADYPFDMFGDDENDIPWGCDACGGDWPNCKTSCSMYDD